MAAASAFSVRTMSIVHILTPCECLGNTTREGWGEGRHLASGYLCPVARPQKRPQEKICNKRGVNEDDELRTNVCLEYPVL